MPQEDRNGAFLDKLSLVLTGKLAESKDLDAYVSGGLEIDAYLETLRTDPGFESKMIQYWMSVLKIQGKFETSPVMGPGVKPESLATQSVDFTFEKSRIIDYTTISDKGIYNQMRNRKACTVPRITRTFARQVIFTDQALEDRNNACKANPDLVKQAACLKANQTYLTTRRPKQLADLDAVECACGTEVNVSPWWNPAVQLKACPEAVTTCGANLSKCELFDTRFDSKLLSQHKNNYSEFNSYGTAVIEALTTEPARIIARNIVSNESFSEVLTTSSTFLNGAAEHYLSTFGSLLVRNAPARSYKSSDGKSVLVSNQSSRAEYRRIDRGPRHAGILTTPMFHQVTNGYRAKANRVYEGFLCRRFIISAEVPSSPSDVTDLTKRQPCAQCHQTLEPLGGFFGKWEQTGINYLYDSTRNAQGSFGNSMGDDTKALGEALGTASDFDKCAVQRAFEIAMGREITVKESQSLLPELVKTFRENGRKFWPILKTIMTAPFYRGAFL
jgi:hypothetical protein